MLAVIVAGQMATQPDSMAFPLSLLDPLELFLRPCGGPKKGPLGDGLQLEGPVLEMMKQNTFGWGRGLPGGLLVDQILFLCGFHNGGAIREV